MLRTFALVLNWNNPDDTVNCVRSVRAGQIIPEQIIVVDNGSSGYLAAMLEKQLDGHCHLIRNAENLGYAGGLRPGINYCLEQGADLIWIMNNDIIVQTETLTRLLDAVERNGFGCLYSPKIVRLDNPDRVYFAGKYFNKKTGDFEPQPSGQTNQYRLNECDLLSDVIQGSCFLLPACIVQQHGFMDESFFLYYEEFDYAMRLAGYGIKCICVLSAVILHKIEGTTCSNRLALDRVRLYYRIRNKVILFRRYCGPGCTAWLLLNFVLRQAAALVWPPAGELSAARIRSRAMWHGLLGRTGRMYAPAWNENPDEHKP